MIRQFPGNPHLGGVNVLFIHYPGTEVAKSLSDCGGPDPVISCIATPALVDKPFGAEVSGGE
jgi:hypothetical protein